MKRFLAALTAFLVLILITLIPLTGCGAGTEEKLKVVTSTTLMEYIVKQVAGDRLEVVNMVPPNQHPGNFDVKPGDIETLARARLFLLHGWPGEGYADKLIGAVNNPEIKVVKASVDGNWMIPSVQQAATDKVAGVLGEIDSPRAADYTKSAAAYKTRIQAKELEIKNRLSGTGVAAVKVIASTRQADFLQWAGFNVVATFANQQALTVSLTKDLIDKGKAEGVILVVNNLQDGADAGRGIAQELGIPNLNLSNFPGGLEDTVTWEKAIDRNVDLLLNALKK